jgi:hypothetical protein
MALDLEADLVEEQEEVEEDEEVQLDAPAHHPSAPPDEVAINGSDITWFLFCSFFPFSSYLFYSLSLRSLSVCK